MWFQSRLTDWGISWQLRICDGFRFIWLVKVLYFYFYIIIPKISTAIIWKKKINNIPLIDDCEDGINLSFKKLNQNIPLEYSFYSPLTESGTTHRWYFLLNNDWSTSHHVLSCLMKSFETPSVLEPKNHGISNLHCSYRIMRSVKYVFTSVFPDVHVYQSNQNISS